ncbi:hypothetical protein HK097_003072 [Rhizophlyctis rosea]|uniref:Uncharacterized protein n=1 Tax=Rhizophlyctis rosea TaxID=64517 RepID=A0AAD5SF55_9FUNG|nr:hypothetical protein HK097_003072 [Rhizophlyctis rosea]
MFVSLVRPWKLQVAQAQADYYGGFFETYGNFIKEGHSDPIPLGPLLSTTRFNILLKNPMFHFQDKLSWMFKIIPTHDALKLLDILIPMLSFPTESNESELQLDTFDGEVDVKSRQCTQPDRGDTSLCILKNPIFHLNGEVLGRRWMYVAQTWRDSPLMVSFGEKFVMLPRNYQFAKMFGGP